MEKVAKRGLEFALNGRQSPACSGGFQSRQIQRLHTSVVIA